MLNNFILHEFSLITHEFARIIRRNLYYFVICTLTFVIFLFQSSISVAEIEKMGFENQHSVKFSVRSDDDDYDLYSTRAQGYLDYSFPGSERTIKVLSFFEYQSNFDTNTWWRKEAGAEIGATFFNDWLYAGASFQHVWQKEENYPVELLDETTEWESRFVITPPLQWGVFKDRLKLRFFDEYTYDFRRGQGTFNEVGVIFDWQVCEGLRFPIRWSHLDRIHDFDSDAIELSVLFSI